MIAPMIGVRPRIGQKKQQNMRPSQRSSARRSSSKGKSSAALPCCWMSYPTPTGLPRADVQAVINLAIDREWFRLGHNYIELQAAGIYVAKEMLDLLR